MSEKDNNKTLSRRDFENKNKEWTDEGLKLAVESIGTADDYVNYGTSKVMGLQDNTIEAEESPTIEIDGEETVIDTNTGERIIVADNQEDPEENENDTAVVINNDANNILDETTGLTTNQILLGILGTLNTRNKLAQEQNKRLRTTNKLLRRMAGLEASTDKTIQGTPPKDTSLSKLQDNVEQSNDFSE